MSKSKVCLHWTALAYAAWLLTCDYISISAPSQCQMINLYTSKKYITIVISICPEISRNRWCHVKQWCNLQWSNEQTPLVPVSLIIIRTALMGTQHPLMPLRPTLRWTLLQLGLGPMSRNFYTMPEDPRPRPRLKGDGLKYAMLFSV